jgi:hypothetical protein
MGPNDGSSAREGKTAHRVTVGAGARTDRASRAPRQGDPRATRRRSGRGIETQARHGAEARRCNPRGRAVESSVARVAWRSDGGAPAAWCAGARALRLWLAFSGRSPGPSSRGFAAARAGWRGGRGAGCLERSVFLPRSRARRTARQDRGEPASASGVRGGAGAGSSGRVQRSASRPARADDQGEPSNLDVHRAVRATRTGAATGPARWARAHRPSRGRATPGAMASACRGRGQDRGHVSTSRGRVASPDGSGQLARGLVAGRVGIARRGCHGTRDRCCTSPDDAADARAHRAALGSAERRARHDVPLPDGPRGSPGSALDARNLRARVAVLGRDEHTGSLAPGARPGPGRSAGGARGSRDQRQARGDPRARGRRVVGRIACG